MHKIIDPDHPVRSRPAASRTLFSRLEREVIRLGIRDGELSARRARTLGFHFLSAGMRGQPLSNPALEALRSWTELARALLADGRTLPTTTLAQAGYTPTQIAEAQQLVDASIRPVSPVSRKGGGA